MKNSSNILLGILGAAAAGVVIGMIIAPQKGSGLRKDIKVSAGDIVKKLGDLISRGKEKYDELNVMLAEQSDELKNDAKGLRTQANETYNDLTNDAAKAYRKMKN